ncbi:MAG: YciI family protein [Thermomicrobiales bacterium]
MRFMLLIYQDEQVLTDAAREACYVESAGLSQDLNRTGNFHSAAPLLPVGTATSVRVREGKRLLTDGPFAETREQLGGYFMIEAANAEEAIEIAGRIPGAKFGTVEVRQVMEIGGVPAADEIVAKQAVTI